MYIKFTHIFTIFIILFLFKKAPFVLLKIKQTSIKLNAGDMNNEKLYRIATNTSFSWCFFNICEVSRHFHCIDRCWNPYAEYLWIIYGPIIGSLLVRLAIYLYHVTGASEQTPIPIQKHFHNICISQAFTLNTPDNNHKANYPTRSYALLFSTLCAT